MATAGDLIDLATSELGDPGNAVWGRTKLLGYLNDGLKQLAFYRPAEFVAHSTVTLVAGAKQTLPDNVVGIVSPICNLDATGLVRGRAIRLVQKPLLDAAAPNWQFADAGETRQIVLAPDPGNEFYVSPPAIDGAKIELQCEVNPEVVAQGTTLKVDAKWHPSLVNYVIFRALAEDADYGADDGRAARFYELFLSVVKVPDAAT